MDIKTRLLGIVAAVLVSCTAATVFAETAVPPASTVAEQEIRNLESARQTASIVLDGRELFRVTGVSGFPAEERSKRIHVQLLKFARSKRPVDELVLTPTAHYTLISFGGERLVAVHDFDAQAEGVDRDTLAEITQRRIQEAVTQFRAERQPAYLLRQAVDAAIATGLVLVLLLLVNRGTRLVKRAIDRRFSNLFAKMEGKSQRLVRARWVRSGLRTIMNGAATVLVIVASFLYLSYVLQLFPWTRPFGERLISLFMTPLSAFGQGVVESLPKIAFLVVLFFVVRYLLRFILLVFESVKSGTVTFENFDPDWAMPTYRIVRVLVIAFALVVAYPYIPGSESAAFKGVSLFLGVVFSLGSTSIISNLIAGYSLTYRRAFREGDVIRVGDTMGRVTNVRLQVTHLRNPRNEEVIVPNSELLNSSITNYSSLSRAAGGLYLHTQVGIGYEVPWRQVESMLLLAAERTSGLLRNPPPFVLQKSLGDFAVVYELNAATGEPATQYVQYSELHRNILDVFNEYGVQIMTPAYEGDPEVAKVVPKERWHEAPAQPPIGTTRTEPAGSFSEPK
jgi:small-conductance mechanosensitive channel